MSYFGQQFANVTEDYGQIQLTSSAKGLYNTQFIFYYHEFYDLYLEKYMWNTSIYNWVSVGRIWFSGKPKHCSMLDFVRVVHATTHHQEDEDRSFDVSFSINNHRIIIHVKTSKAAVSLHLSPKLMKLFSIKDQQWEFNDYYQTRTHTIPIVAPASVVDNSEVLFTPVMDKSWIKINGKQVVIPKMYWIFYSLKKALPIMFKEVFPEFVVYFFEMQEFEYWLQIEHLPANYVIELSDSLKSFVAINKDVQMCTLILRFHERPKNANIEEDNVSFDLTYNYYPTEASLIKDLNTLTVKHINKFMQAKVSDGYTEKVFTIDEASNICSFIATPNFNVNLSSYLLNVLQLYNTYESNTAKAPMRLMTAIRPFLHVYCDLIVPHNVNSEEESLLRIINNVAKENEKVMLTFDYPHYYQISRRFINNIRLYITDGFGEDPLGFLHQVSYLLHFRQCQHK